MKKTLLLLILIFQLSIFNFHSFAQSPAPSVLIIDAHPDDETAYAVTVYKITHELHGTADIVLITNGEGGYKYSTLAEAYYHLELTDEKTGRANLPRIRKQEMMNAGAIIGVRNYFFLDQWDRRYTTDEREPLDSIWDVQQVKKSLTDIMTKTHYDYVFCLLPVPATHGHHKAATMLALQTVSALPAGNRPIVLGSEDSAKNEELPEFLQLKDYKETAINKTAPVFTLDRTVKFGYKDMLDYRIIVNWEVAEHKSQGTIQTGANHGEVEHFLYFNINDASGIEKTQKLFEELKKVPYPAKKY